MSPGHQLEPPRRSRRVVARATLAVGVLLCASAYVTTLAQPGATPSPPAADRMGYRAPTAGPAGPLTVAVDRPFGKVWGQAIGNLRSMGFALDEVDEARGTVVARYAGEPRDFVDCGTITIARDDGGEARELPAASATLTFARAQGEGSVEIRRDLALDARLVLALSAQGAGSTVAARSSYVLTRTVSAAGAEPRVEIVTFDSGERGRFGKGTACVATGTLERLALLDIAS